MVEWAPDPAALPLLARAANGQADSGGLRTWLAANLPEVQHRLYRHGAILFRGFGVSVPAQLRAIADLFCHATGEYIGGNSPRTHVEARVFTSTEYPREERISMHNEASYLRDMPSTVLFCCGRPAATGGQTPLADCRRVLARLNPDLRTRFDRTGIRYVNNLHGGAGFGRSWQQAYGTTDRDDVERRLRAAGNAFAWKADGSLRICMQAPATARHAQTGEEVWINQAEQWHASSLNAELREELLSFMAEDDLPHNAFFGDGSPLALRDLEETRTAMAAEERVFEWQQGDLLVCDNYLVMHGRQPYTGDRQILVAMG